jgi:hypothetical protein
VREFTDDAAPHQFAFEAYGVAVRVCASSQELLARIEPLLPPGRRPLDAQKTRRRIGLLERPSGGYALYNGPSPVEQLDDLESALARLDTRLRGYVAESAPDLIFVHAGVVGHRGRALVLPGASFAGKTTAVAALVRVGATYYSDEFAVFDSDGLVHPYAKPLSLRPALTAGNSRARQAEHTVESLGGVAGEQPLPLGAAAMTHYAADARWRPRRLSTGEAVLALVSQTISARVRPEATMRVLSRALERAVVFEGERGDADEFARTLLEVAESEWST